jgi:hypothetical chaperone protein
MVRTDYCAIDFGTSNSAVAIAAPEGVRLVPLEDAETSLPTAVFYNADDATRTYGRDAIAHYVDGVEGRLMRSIKSILGSDLMDEATDIGSGHAVRYLDVVIGYLRHLRTRVAGGTRGAPSRVVLGRPVFFDDDDAVRDARAQGTLEAAARAAGFKEVAFQFEPIAAALDFESRSTREHLVLVVDIGGGTSDFSVVRTSPDRHARLDRRADILANHGVHIAGTDFDRAVNLAAIMPALGYGSAGPDGRIVPSSIYFELATWHLINRVSTPLRIAELRQMRTMYGSTDLHARLLRVLQARLGHLLATRAEAAKIDVSLHGATVIDLDAVESGMRVAWDASSQAEALEQDLERIAATAIGSARLAGVTAEAIDVVYFTGGSTGLSALTDRIGAAFPRAQTVRGDRFASVVGGLAIYANRLFGARANHEACLRR